MEIPTKQDIMALIEESSGPHISLFTPMERMGPETMGNPTRLKNVRTAAERQLIERGMANQDAEAMLAPVAELEGDFEFWQNQLEGFALFLNQKGMRWFRVPLQFQENAFVLPRFHIKPLLPLLTANTVFHVLAISANHTRVLECTPNYQEEVKPDGLPRNITDALWPEDPEKQVQFRSFYTGASGGSAMFHGAGGSEPDRKQDLLRYFHMVDDAMAPYLRERGGPLVLACVDYLAPIYREANSYGDLMEKNVSGNPDEAQDEALRTMAWEIVRPRVEADREEAVERYRSLAGTGLTSSDPAEAALAATTGRVDTAFVTLGKHVWGHVDGDAYTVTLRDEPGPEDYDLLDVIAAHTLANSGRVFAVEEDQAPEPTGVAALFRY